MNLHIQNYLESFEVKEAKGGGTRLNLSIVFRHRDDREVVKALVNQLAHQSLGGGLKIKQLELTWKQE